MKPSLILLITTVATGTLYVLSFVALGNAPPTIESSGQEILAWFSNNGTRARTYAWMMIFVSLGFTVLGGQVSALLPKPHRYIFLGGVLGFAITAQIQAWFWAGLAFHPEGLDPGAARVIFDIPLYWGPVVNSSMVAMAAAVIVLGFGASPIIPRWLTWLGVIFCLEQAIETITVFGRAGFIAPSGPMNLYLGGTLGFLWVAGLAGWAFQRIDSGGQPERKPAS